MDIWIMSFIQGLIIVGWMQFLIWEPAQRAREWEAKRIDEEWRVIGYDSIEDYYFWNHVRSYA